MKRVLQALLDAPAGSAYGFELARTTGLPTGSIYPILRRLEQARWIRSWAEEIDESREGRRRRRYYELTGVGRNAAFELTAGESEALRILNPGWVS